MTHLVVVVSRVVVHEPLELARFAVFLNDAPLHFSYVVVKLVH